MASGSSPTATPSPCPSPSTPTSSPSTRPSPPTSTSSSRSSRASARPRPHWPAPSSNAAWHPRPAPSTNRSSAACRSSRTCSTNWKACRRPSEAASSPQLQGRLVDAEQEEDDLDDAERDVLIDEYTAAVELDQLRAEIAALKDLVGAGPQGARGRQRLQAQGPQGMPGARHSSPNSRTAAASCCCSPSTATR